MNIQRDHYHCFYQVQNIGSVLLALASSAASSCSSALQLPKNVLALQACVAKARLWKTTDLVSSTNRPLRQTAWRCHSDFALNCLYHHHILAGLSSHAGSLAKHAPLAYPAKVVDNCHLVLSGAQKARVRESASRQVPTRRSVCD